MRSAKGDTTMTAKNNNSGGGLKRDLGNIQSYATLIGVLIGSGIFVVIGQAGSVAGPSVPLAYLAMAPIVLCTALAYMVYLSTPLGNRPGGAYIHISRTFNSLYPGFIAVWLKLVAFMGAMGVLSLSFGEYLTFFIPRANPVVVASLLMIFFYIINLVGVKIYGQIQVIMCFVLLAAVLILVIPGLRTIDMNNYTPLFPFGMKGFLSALAPLFMSYAGFEALAQTAGETKDARKNLPKVFLKGILLTIAIYFAMSFVAFGNMPFAELASSKSAMADVAARYLPFGAAAIVAIGAMMAFTTSINASLMVPPRLLLVLAEDHLVPGILGHIHPRFHTPDVSLTLTTAITLGLLWTNTLNVILAVTLQAIFLLYIFHSLSMVCLPFVNRPLYNSALFRPHPLLLVAGGLFSAFCLIFFSYQMIIGTWKLILVWSIIGTLLYGFGRFQATRKGVDLAGLLADELD